MWNQITQIWDKTKSSRYTAEILALLGGAIYLWQAIADAQTRSSFIDEGLYLFKGFLFASGQYQPFQDFGPWTNHMPLSYLIPGYVQAWFGPGLRTGRYFSIFLAGITILGLWVVTRRLAGRWWAVAVVWAVALNIAGIKLYTLAISQAIVACMLVWVLVLSLGEDRPTWQIMLASALSGLMILVRINMAPVLPLLILYIFWQHGKRKGLWSLFVGFTTLALGHAFFWPEILKIWAAWLPRHLTPWLNTWRLANPPEKWYTSAALPDPVERTLYFFLTFRLYFLGLVGALTIWFLWPGSSRMWKTVSQYRTSVFLSILLLTLLVMHMWAAFVFGFCISCILLYVAFFYILGLILLAVAFSAVKRTISPWREAVVVILVVIFLLGMAYSTYSDLGKVWARLAVPLVGSNLQEGSIWEGFANMLGVAYFNLLRVVAALAGGIALVILVLVLAKALQLLLSRTRTRQVGYSFVLLCTVLILGFLLSPTILLSKGNDFFACGGDVLGAYEATGEYLNETIHPGSSVFWLGRLPALFLYTPEVEIYPPQLNHFHSFRFGGVDQELSRFGLWNQSLGEKWILEADYVLVEEEWLDGWVIESIEAGGMVELQPAPIPDPCRETSRIRIFVSQ
jgi:hypothetical protein